MTLTITFNKLTSVSPRMIVCHCYGITDREVRASIQGGARTCSEVTSACGAGAGCGGCTSLVSEIVQGERRRLAVLRSEHGSAPRACVGGPNEEAAQQSA